MYNPTDGHLTTIQELELTGWNLDEWLRRTDDHKGDAWAQGNTNRAFAINDFVGIERSHTDNDWKSFGAHLETRGKGTYTHVAGPPTLVASISNDLTPTIVQEGNWDNSLGKAPGTFTLNYAKTQSRTVSLAVTKTAKFNTEAKFALEGFEFKLSDTYDISNQASNSQTDTTTVTETVSRVLAPGEKIHYSVAQSKSTLVSKYAVVVRISGIDPNGTIGKARHQQDKWDDFIPIEALAGDILKDEATYVVTSQVMTTDITLTQTSPPTSTPAIPSSGAVAAGDF